jgi:hypothetical protein
MFLKNRWLLMFLKNHLRLTFRSCRKIQQRLTFRKIHWRLKSLMFQQSRMFQQSQKFLKFLKFRWFQPIQKFPMSRLCRMFRFLRKHLLG